MTIKLKPDSGVGAATPADSGQLQALRTGFGLGNVDNTSDAEKPISADAQAAFDALAPVNNLTTNDATKPLSAAQGVALKAAVDAAGGAALPIAAALVIPLDTAGNGKVMASQTLTSASAITFSGPVEQGNCTFCLIGDGNSAHVPDFTAWKLGNSYAYDYTAGVKNIYAALYTFGVPFLYGTGNGAGSVVAAPVFTAQDAPDGTLGVLYTPYQYVATGAVSFAVGTGMLPAGLSLSSGGLLTGTPTAAATSTFTVTATNPGGTTQSIAQSVVVTSGVVAPGAATVAAGTPTTTTIPLTITAPTTGGAPTSYAVFYKRATDTSYTAGPVGTSLTPTITGLTDTTSYNVKVVPSNGAGAGPDSNILTVSTQSAYVVALKALSPSGLWLLDEAPGATTFADSSGNGNTLTAAGTLLAGVMGMTPNVSSKNALNFLGTGGDLTANPLQGRLRAASNALFDYSAATSFSFMATVDLSQPSGSAQVFMCKSATGDDGYQLLTYPANLELKIAGVGYRVNLVPTGATLGPVHLAYAVDFVGSATNAVRIWIDGVLTQFDRTSTATALSHLADPFILGGRADGYSVIGRMQCAAFWSGVALSDAQVQALFTKHQQADRTNAIPVVLDTDNGTTDSDDFTELAQTIYWHLIGRVNLLGVIVTASDDYAAPSARAQLDYYGLTAIPVGAYQGSGIPSGGSGGPAGVVKTHFRPSDARANYTDAATMYGTILSAAANGSVVVMGGGTFHSMAQFLNASSGNVTLWNQKVRAVGGGAGQWPNSSSSASPAGNFSTNGEYNFEKGAQQGADFVLKNAAPVYWHGVQICGNAGDAPTLGNFVNSVSPGNWDNSVNPLTYPSGWIRTAWGQMCRYSLLEQMFRGTANPYWGTVQIATPTINTTTGQNSSVAGSAQHYYFTPKVGALSIGQWRTMMSAQMDLLFPKQSNTYSG